VADCHGPQRADPVAEPAAEHHRHNAEALAGGGDGIHQGRLPRPGGAMAEGGMAVELHHINEEHVEDHADEGHQRTDLQHQAPLAGEGG